MARTTTRTTTAARPDDRASLELENAALRRENAELKARLAKGPTDETWFTPGLLGVLALGLFFALWAKYNPLARTRAAAPAAVTAPGDYNPPAR